jgi:uncharacterized protein YutE (UPF0331/DUF86 family)
MYFVDCKKIEELLMFLGDCLETFEHESFEGTRKDHFSLERIAHMTVESLLDIGNMMIDGFIMRDPGSYEDIIDILEDENVVSKQDANGLKQVVSLRKQLVQTYTEINHRELKETLNANLASLKRFPLQIRTYLTEELGPVSAFLPNEQNE